MRSLVYQIKRDHAQLNGLFERFEAGENDLFLIEEIQKVLSWLGLELNTFKEMNKTGIEGLSWGEINIIDRDIKEKERNLKLFLYSLSMELEHTLGSHSGFGH
jgi:hypothetical protein